MGLQTLSKLPCILFDIDGTLANLEHRRHFVTGRKKDWPSFDKLMHLDTPIEQTIFLNNLINWHGLMPIFCASGRADHKRETTETWLEKEGVHYKRLFMRKSGDYRADHIIKKEILEEIRGLGYEPWLVFDDRQCVVDMWRKEGLFVLQCDPNPSETFHDAYHFGPHIEWPLTILVGPSGAGKSTYVSGRHDVISSDQLRQEICGDFRSQEENERVFEAMHTLARERLKLGLPVVLDATHLKNADRIKAAKLLPETIPVRYMVFNRSVVEKEATGGWRNAVSVKGTTLIRYHDQVFKSNIKDILKGDGLPNVTVIDMRESK